MNILEAYIKFKGQCIILFSGFSGSTKTEIANFIANLLKFQFVKLSRFYKSSDVFDKEQNYIETKSGLKVLGWDNIYDSIDWDKFNEFVNQNKQSGLVIVGFGFPKKLLKFEVDINIHIKISKQQLIENRNAYVKKHNSNVTDNELQTDKMILNNVTYPLYLKVLEESEIKHNIVGLSGIETKLSIFKTIINDIQSWLSKNPNVSKPLSLNKPKKKLHFDGNDEAYDEFYYPNSKRVNYDFDDNGDEIQSDNKSKSSSSSTSSSSRSDSDDSDDEDSTFLFTTQSQ